MNIKVLMFGWEFPPHNSGGLGTACYGLCKALSDKPVDLTFVLPVEVKTPKDWVNIAFACIKNIALRGINALLSPYMTSEKYRKLVPKKHSIYADSLFGEVLRYAEAAGEIAENYQYDVIHAHEWLSYPAGIKVKEVSGKPLILHVHSTEVDRSGGFINEEVYDLEKAAFEEADCVVAVSEYTKKILIDRYDVPQEKVQVVHNGVDVGLYSQGDAGPNSIYIKNLKKEGYKIVLYVGRFSLHKGPDYFIRAAQKVLQYYPKVVFIMAGSGEMQNELIELAADLGISDKILFSGFLRGDELETVYKSADLYVLPSVSEPFGIAPLESLINGTPVLLSKQSGVAGILKHALKVDFWDTDEMTNKIVAALTYNSLNRELSKNGKKEAKNITWKKSADKLVGIYKRISRNL